MPFRPSFSALLYRARDEERREAMEAVEAARRVRDEAFARSRLTPVVPLEGRATPVAPPNGKKAA